MPWLAAATLAAPIVGGLMGQNAASGAKTASENAYKNAMAQFANINTPQLSQLDLANLQNAGNLQNSQEQNIQLGPASAEGIILNPAARAAQNQAMEQFQQRMLTGSTPADTAMFELNRRNAAAEAEAKSGQILQNMQARGMGGSGAELIARLQAGQSGADRQAAMGAQEAIASQHAREQAAQNVFSSGANMRNQDNSEQQYLANARQNVNNINNAASIDRQARNVASQNSANQYNVQNTQRISDANTGFRNQERTYNTTQLPQNNFNNQMTLGSARAGANTNYGNTQAANAANTAAGWAQVGQGVGNGVAGYNQLQTQNEQFGKMMDMYKSHQKNTQSLQSLPNWSAPEATPSQYSLGDNKVTSGY